MNHSIFKDTFENLTRIHYYDTLTTANLFTAEEVQELL